MGLPKRYLAKQQLLKTQSKQRRLMSMLGGGTAEQEEEEEERHLKSASTSLKDTFLPPPPILVASMQRTSLHQKWFNLLLLTIFQCIQAFWSKSLCLRSFWASILGQDKTLSNLFNSWCSCFEHCAVPILAHSQRSEYILLYILTYNMYEGEWQYILLILFLFLFGLLAAVADPCLPWWWWSVSF